MEDYHETTTSRVDKGYAWQLKNIEYQENNTWKLSVEQKEYYLWLSASGLATNEDSKSIYAEYDITTDSSTGKEAVVMYLRGDGQDRYLGWDSKSKSFTVGNTKKNAIAIKAYQNVNIASNMQEYVKLTDLSKIKDYDNFILVYSGKKGKYVISPYESYTEGSLKVGDEYMGAWGSCPLISALVNGESNNIITTDAHFALTLGDNTKSNSKGDWEEYSNASFGLGKLYLGGTRLSTTNTKSAVPYGITSAENKKCVFIIIAIKVHLISVETDQVGGYQLRHYTNIIVLMSSPAIVKVIVTQRL